mmetsp:Transcript_56348/g.123456  ORF Transcript_56348/g.123456 Transcript_56348/m.123456 type:complete len:274 (-) Transcript_56348:805-1626(-)
MPPVTYTGIPGTTGIRNMEKPTRKKTTATSPKESSSSSPLSQDRKMKVSLATPTDITKYSSAHLQTQGKTFPQFLLAKLSHTAEPTGVIHLVCPCARPVQSRAICVMEDSAKNISSGKKTGIIMAPKNQLWEETLRMFLTTRLLSPPSAEKSSVRAAHRITTVKIAKENPSMVSLKLMEAPAMEAESHNVITSKAKSITTICTADFARSTRASPSAVASGMYKIRRRQKMAHTPILRDATKGLPQVRYRVRFPFLQSESLSIRVSRSKASQDR